MFGGGSDVKGQCGDHAAGTRPELSSVKDMTDRVTENAYYS